MGKGYTSDCMQCNDNKHLPRDTVQSMRWLPGNKSTILALAGWDGCLRVYELTNNNNRGSLEQRYCQFFGLPITAIEWISEGTILLATMDGILHIADVKNNQHKELFKTNYPICEIKFKDKDNRSPDPFVLIFTCDDTVFYHRIYSNDQFPSASQRLKYKIVCAELEDSFLVVGLADSKCLILDLNNHQPGKDISSTLYHDSGLQTKIGCVSIKKSKDKIVFSGIDGRISVQSIKTGYSTNSFILNNDIVFRAHKTSQGSKPELIHSVTSTQFCPSRDNDNAISTTSICGEVKFWDLGKREDCYTIDAKNRQISTGRFNQDGTLFAFSTGYSWNEGIWGLNNVNYAPEIFVTVVESNMIRP